MKELDPIPILNKLPQPLKRGLYFSLVSSLGFAASGCGNTEASVASSNSRAPLRLPFSGTWYLTGGPHYDGLSNGVRYGVDFAPGVVINCPGGILPVDNFVEASASGKVTKVGDENNPQDKNHSIVEIDHGSGLTTVYMHLNDILVEKDQLVRQGELLGYPSCEVPPGGATSGIHLHFGIKKDSKPIPINGLTLSGWKIEEGGGNYQGKMTKDGAVRTADRGRCGPSLESIKACGGARNDLTIDPLDLTIKSPTKPAALPTERPTSIPKPTSKLAPTAIRPPERPPQRVEQQSLTVDQQAQRLAIERWINNFNPTRRNIDNVLSEELGIAPGVGKESTYQINGAFLENGNKKESLFMYDPNLLLSAIKNSTSLIRVQWELHDTAESFLFGYLMGGYWNAETEAKRFTIASSPRNLSALDRENGYGWVGTIRINYIYRTMGVYSETEEAALSLSKNQPWSDWKEGVKRYDLILRNNQWNINGSNLPIRLFPNRPRCHGACSMY